MARDELHSRLPTEMKGYIEPQAAKPAPSFLEAIADAGSAFIRANNVGTGNRRAKEKGHEDAAKNLAAKGAVFAMTGESHGDPHIAAAVRSAQDLTPKLLSQQEAADQGRGHAAAVRVRSEAMIRELIAQYPGQEYTILSTLRENGITSYAMKEYERAEKAIDDDIAEDRRMEGKYADIAMELGYGNWREMSPTQKAQVQPKIDEYLGGMAKFKLADQIADTKLKQVNLTKAEQEELDRQEDDLRLRGFMDTMGPGADAFLLNTTKILTNPQMSDAEKEEALSKLAAFGTTELPRMFNQAMGLYGARMRPESRSLVTQQFERMQKAIVDMVTGPASIVERNKRMYEVLTKTMGIEVHKALPFWAYLKSAVGGETLSTLFTNDILNSPQIIQKLREEFKMAETLAPGEERLRFNNVIKILKGEGKLTDYSPEEIRQHAPVVLKAMNGLSRNSAVTNGTDEQSHADFMRTIENASSVAVEATPQWGYKNLSQIAEVFLQQGVGRGLVGTTKNREERTAAINSYQPALQNVYMALSNVKSGDKYYDLQWDNQSASWKLKWNGVKQTIQQPTMQSQGLGSSPSQSVKPRPSEAAVKQARLLNTMIDQQSALSRGGWDPNAPANISDRERRMYYGRGVVPESLKKDEKEPKSMKENVDRLIQEFSAGLNASPGYKTGDITDLPTAADIAKKHEKNPNYAGMAPIIEGEAKSIDMPLDVAMRLFDRESGFKPDAQSKAGAYGPGQIMPSTAKLYGVDDLKALTPEQNIKLAFRILKDNFKRFGNWADAISAYHSGRSLAAAAAAGANDGLMATKDYVASIAGDLL